MQLLAAQVHIGCGPGTALTQKTPKVPKQVGHLFPVLQSTAVGWIADNNSIFQTLRIFKPCPLQENPLPARQATTVGRFFGTCSLRKPSYPRARKLSSG